MRLIEEIARNMAMADNKAMFWQQYEAHVRKVIEGVRDGVLVKNDSLSHTIAAELNRILNEKNS